MAEYRLTQQKLLALCRDPLESNENELIVLKDLLIGLGKEEQWHLIDAEDETNRAPLFYAIESGKSIDFLRTLLEYDLRITNRILLCALRYGNIDTLELLNEYGADFRQTFHGLSLLHECILLHKNHLIRFLVEQGGISPDATDYDRQTPLSFAILRVNTEAIEVLLRYSTVDPCSISTRKRHITSFHLACELGLEEVLPMMLEKISPSNINKLSANDQTPFDLFLSSYLFSKRSLEKDEIFYEKFSNLFDLFLSKGAKLHHLTRAYRRTRAKCVMRVFTIIFQKSILFSDLLLLTDVSTILNDFQTLVCQALGDCVPLIESKEHVTSKERQLTLRQLYELFLIVFYKSPNRQSMNMKLIKRYCSANEKDSKMKQILWLFMTSIFEKRTEPDLLKSICRKNVLLSVDSVLEHCTSTYLPISKDLENYLLFLCTF